VVTGRGLGSAPLGVWPFNHNTHALIWSLPAALSMLGAAFVIGASVAWVAMRRGDRASATWVSGLTGPLLVTVAYDLTAPHLVGINDSQMSAYVFAPQALIAGIIGSALVVAIFTARASAQAAATLPATMDFRAPSDPTGSAGSRDSDTTAGSGTAVGRARPPGRLRGTRAASTPVPVPRAEETPKPTPLAAVIPDSTSDGAVPDATTKVPTDVPSTTSGAVKPQPGKRPRR
jgi:hypothetical protein